MSEGVRLYAGTQAALYLCIEHGGIVRRFDRGKSWEDVSKGWARVGKSSTSTCRPIACFGSPPIEKHGVLQFRPFKWFKRPRIFNITASTA